MGQLEHAFKRFGTGRLKAQAGGESVVYHRFMNGQSGDEADGFPLDPVVILFSTLEDEEREYVDGEGFYERALIQVDQESIGSKPIIEKDKITRQNGEQWTIVEMGPDTAGWYTMYAERYTENVSAKRGFRVRR